MNIGIIIGHTYKSKGAVNKDNLSEYDYYKKVIEGISKFSTTENIKYAFRDIDGLTGACRNLTGQFHNTKADIIVELHFNAFKKGHSIRGSEALYNRGNSKKLAEYCSRFFSEKNNSKDRGAVFIDRGRGAENLRIASEFSFKNVLIEPFFGDNSDDFIESERMEILLLELLESLADHI